MSTSPTFLVIPFLLQVLSRLDPYADEDLSNVISDVLNPIQDTLKRPSIPSTASPAVSALIRVCWAEDPEGRPCFADIVKELRGLDLPVGSAVGRHKYQGARDVVYDMFPPHIAKQIMEGRRVEPEEHPMATIFFADVVSFTSLSANLTAGQVSDMLDRLYTALDDLLLLYGVLKIDTIGDAYMVAINVCSEQVS